MLAYRGLPAPAPPRLGRGNNAIVAFMRLAGAEDARAACEQLGTGHRFALAPLTETIGGSVADTAGGAYTSTARARARSPTRHRTASHLAAAAASCCRRGRVPGRRCARHRRERGGQRADRDEYRVGHGDRQGGAGRRIARGGPAALPRIPAGPDELQQLPASAMIVSYPGPAGRQAVLADVNPGIGGLGEATQLTLEEFRVRPPGGTPEPGGAPEHDLPPPGVSLAPPGPGRPGPNLGPPPRRLDWRRGRS